MNFTVIDVGGLLLAVILAIPTIVAPGYALARLFRFASADGENTDTLAGVVVGLALLPALDSLAVRFLGLTPALVLNLGLACLGVLFAVRGRLTQRSSRVGFALLLCWLALVMFEWVDFDVAAKLFQPLTIFDSVKHAATTQAIYDSGAPPRDAFFLRPERSSYYYFFYTLAALVMRLGGGLVDARAAVGALVFWTGIGAYGLIRLTLARTGLAVADGRRAWLTIAIMAAGGLDILAVVFFAWSRAYWVADPLQWNEQVGAWFEDLLWVPHHVTALLAGFVGFFALCSASGAPSGRMPGLRAALLAGICFASALGLSVWVTLGLAVTVAAWSAILLVERKWRHLGLVLASGLIAMVLALPQLIDLKAGRAGGDGIPIAVVVRGFTPIQLLLPEGSAQDLVQLLTLPLNYAIEFGALALGSFLFWRQQRQAGASTNEAGRVLVVATITGLVVGALFRSTLFNNDLGWRVLLLPLLGCTVWTIVALDRWITEARRNTSSAPITATVMLTLIVVGTATTTYGAVMMRAYPFVTINPAARFMAADPATERALRVAYGWAQTHLPASAVLQQNPTRKRALAFGLYGRNPIGVADSFGSLYGADPAAVTARLEAVGPIFQRPLTSPEISERAGKNGIDALVVTAADPVWSQADSFVWREAPLYASGRVRIIPIRTREATR